MRSCQVGHEVTTTITGEIWDLSLMLCLCCFSSHRYSIVYSGVNTSHKVSRLSENTIYKFRICASNEAGNGPYSEEYSFSTLKAPPAAMKGIILGTILI